MGDDHPRPGISADHSTFSVFPHVSASRAFVLTGFESGPRNCGQAASSPRTSPVASIMAQARPIRLSHVLEGVLSGVFMV
jgi:sorbitol-specific phosphotransferase system component IIC